MSNVYAGVAVHVRQCYASNIRATNSAQLHEGHTLVGVDDQSEGN